MERVTQVFGPGWRDQTRQVGYKWRREKEGEEKIGDEAEEVTLESFCNPMFCKLLGEPVYLISGIFGSHLL